MKYVKNGEQWLDTQGNPIHAHGGYIIAHEGYFYWYGEDRRAENYVSCYRSKDLMDWEFRNHILTKNSSVQKIRIRTDLLLENEDGKKVNLERPKVLFNKRTQKFVLWVHYENGRNYNDAGVALATCDTPDGDFVYHGFFRPFGYMSRDCTLFQEADGTAYFISAARDNADTHFYRLSADYLNTEALVGKCWQGEYREAPAVMKTGDDYYILTSGTTGWAPNQCQYAQSKNMEHGWSIMTDIGDETTFKSQPAFILNVGDQSLYFGDRWSGDEYFSSSYVIYPLTITNGQLVMTEVDKVVYENGRFSFL